MHTEAVFWSHQTLEFKGGASQEENYQQCKPAKISEASLFYRGSAGINTAIDVLKLKDTQSRSNQCLSSCFNLCDTVATAAHHNNRSFHVKGWCFYI